MDNYRKYLKYKTKYLKYSLNNKINLIGGSEPIHFVSHYDDDNTYKITIYLFKADWCIHCKNFNDAWNKAASMFKGKVKFIAYDANLHENEIKQWNIKGFPTILINTGGETDPSEYTNSRDDITFINYINKLLE